MIRKARTDECPAIAAFMKQFEQESNIARLDVAYTARKHAELIDRGVGVIFLLCDDVTGEMQGGLGGVVGPSLLVDEKVAVETFWYVAPEHRGSGIRLLLAFEQWAKDRGCDKVAMVHLADLYPETLTRFYARSGYRLTEQHFVKETRA